MGHGSRGKHKTKEEPDIPKLIDQLVGKAVDEVYWTMVAMMTVTALGVDKRRAFIEWLEHDGERLTLYCRNPFEAVQQFKETLQLTLPFEEVQ